MTRCQACCSTWTLAPPHCRRLGQIHADCVACFDTTKESDDDDERQQRASCEDHSLQCLAQTSKGAVAVETDESTAEAVNFHVEDEFDLCESREVFLRW